MLRCLHKIHFAFCKTLTVYYAVGHCVIMGDKLECNPVSVYLSDLMI